LLYIPPYSIGENRSSRANERNEKEDIFHRNYVIPHQRMVARSVIIAYEERAIVIAMRFHLMIVFAFCAFSVSPAERT
jgi:hypothetical protein